VMFFGDPVAAFANLRRALRTGGRLVFACWRPLIENPWMLLPLQVVQTLVPPVPRPGPDEPGPFAFADPERVTHILTTAGFSSPRYIRFEIAMVLGTSLDDATEQATSMGAASRGPARTTGGSHGSGQRGGSRCTGATLRIWKGNTSGRHLARRKPSDVMPEDSGEPEWATCPIPACRWPPPEHSSAPAHDRGSHREAVTCGTVVFPTTA
jgi:hypothetical protein